jgi:hypothetical protein
MRDKATDFEPGCFVQELQKQREVGAGPLQNGHRQNIGREGLQGEKGSAGRLKMEGFGVSGSQGEVLADGLPTKHTRRFKVSHFK